MSAAVLWLISSVLILMVGAFIVCVGILLTVSACVLHAMAGLSIIDSLAQIGLGIISVLCGIVILSHALGSLLLVLQSMMLSKGGKNAKFQQGFGKSSSPGL